MVFWSGVVNTKGQEHNHVLIPTVCSGQLDAVDAHYLLTGIGESGGQLTRPELFTMAHCGQLLQWDSTSHELGDDSEHHIVSGIPDLNRHSIAPHPPV